MSKAYHIDSLNFTINEVTYSSVEDIRKFVGGDLCLGHFNPINGDTLYVDDNGVMKYSYGFLLYGRPNQLFYGNGLIIGREIDNELYPGSLTTLDPVITLDQLKNRVMFAKQRPN